MNFGITLWNALPLKCKIFPDRGPTPLSPVQRQRKFSAVSGTTSARNSISMRPLGEPPMVMSKKTTGFSEVGIACARGWTRRGGSDKEIWIGEKFFVAYHILWYGEYYYFFPKEKVSIVPIYFSKRERVVLRILHLLLREFSSFPKSMAIQY